MWRGTVKSIVTWCMPVQSQPPSLGNDSWNTCNTINHNTVSQVRIVRQQLEQSLCAKPNKCTYQSSPNCIHKLKVRLSSEPHTPMQAATKVEKKSGRGDNISLLHMLSKPLCLCTYVRTYVCPERLGPNHKGHLFGLSSSSSKTPVPQTRTSTSELHASPL